ncbi:MAG: putative spermidine/putrescine transport system permease protein, partial [Acetobacteraceae bacterium]|nr:putative spermidine/putrescine transport system permease protein [Acetobacteraceae bacterium]
MRIKPALASWLQIGPLATVLTLFFGVPVVVVIVVSFFDFDHTDIVPTFILDNYQEIFSSETTGRLYLSSLKFAVIVWAITLVIGFTLANYLVFHVRSLLIKIGLFLLCSVPFWTSTIIRMISWIPFLGRNGLFNTMLMNAGLIS